MSYTILHDFDDNLSFNTHNSYIKNSFPEPQHSPFLSSQRIDLQPRDLEEQAKKVSRFLQKDIFPHIPRGCGGSKGGKCFLSLLKISTRIVVRASDE